MQRAAVTCCLAAVLQGGSACRKVQVSAHPESLSPCEPCCCRYVLRNWIAQQAIEKAEAGDHSEVRRVLRLLEHPFSDDNVEQLPPGGSVGSSSCQRGPPQYDGPVPGQYQKLCVSCSS